MKKVLCIVFILCISFTFVGCGTEYADTNGEKDFTLQTITDENIINMETGSSGLVYEEESVGALHSSEYSSKNFNGVEQIYGTNFLHISWASAGISFLGIAIKFCNNFCIMLNVCRGYRC